MITILQQKLMAMRKEAPHAGIHLLLDANSFTVLLGEAKAAAQYSPLVRLANHGDDWEDVWQGRIPVTDMLAAVEQITAHASVALMDLYCEAGYKGRPVMFAYFPVRGGKAEPVEDEWA